MQIIEADQPLNVDALFCVIYGFPGVGKTSLAFTGPGNCLLIDADHGIQRAIGKKRPPAIRIDSYKEFWEEVRSPKFEKFVKDRKIDTVIIDTVGTLLEGKMAPFIIAMDPKNASPMGGLSLPGYGALGVLFRALRDRLINLGLNVICVCHCKEEGEGVNRRLELSVVGQSAGLLYQVADLMGYMSVSGENRKIAFAPNGLHLGKSIGKIETTIVPDAISPEYDDCLARVFEIAKANIAANGTSLAEFEAKLSEWRSAVKAASTESDFERLLADARGVASESLKSHIRPIIGKRMKELGMKWDDASKKVVSEEAEIGE